MVSSSSVCGGLASFPQGIPVASTENRKATLFFYAHEGVGFAMEELVSVENVGGCCSGRILLKSSVRIILEYG